MFHNFLKLVIKVSSKVILKGLISANVQKEVIKWPEVVCMIRVTSERDVAIAVCINIDITRNVELCANKLILLIKLINWM